MKERELNQLLEETKRLNTLISEFIEQKTLILQETNQSEIQGHILKSENNLRFVQENIKLGFLDWAITGCYYACYHSALALILTKGYTSKNHLATLCILIKEFYNTELKKEDIETISTLLDYQDVLFYVESKNKREDATYSTKTKFDIKEANELKLKAALFVAKTKTILNKTLK